MCSKRAAFAWCLHTRAMPATKGVDPNSSGNGQVLLLLNQRHEKYLYLHTHTHIYTRVCASGVWLLKRLVFRCECVKATDPFKTYDIQAVPTADAWTHYQEISCALLGKLQGPTMKPRVLDNTLFLGRKFYFFLSLSLSLSLSHPPALAKAQSV